MPDVRFKKLLHSKSFTSVYGIIDESISHGNLIHDLGLNKIAKCHWVHPDADSESRKHSLDYSISDKYYTLDNVSSCKTIIPSASTIFYDLDDIAKRHSYHCFTEPSSSNANFMKVMKMPARVNVFGGASNAIVQECATQIHPKLHPRDSIEINYRKVKKKHSKLSSEICLRDDDYGHDNQTYFNKNLPSRHQKFWSYSKYHTEYTKPIPQGNKTKKKDRGKRTEDPCPCQLFSYACPCTDKKSLTELAKNSKSLTIVDQITSTSKFVTEQKKHTRSNKTKNNKHDVMEDKPTNTSIAEMVEVIVPNKKHDPSMHVTNTKLNNSNKNAKNKFKFNKKSRRVLCPNCKEKVDVVMSTSTTEEEESLKGEDSSIYRCKDISSTTAYACRASPNGHRSLAMAGDDLCQHEPRCELLPVCQILPTDNNLYNVTQKCVNSNPVTKSTPRVIRITKACRHHPPCTVVPSCQRATVLNNNCEFIPPCLHRPRCVNLPLCVPFSKNLHYEEGINKVVENRETSECPHIPRCKYVPVCQHDSLTNTMNHQVNMISRMQNGCEFLNDYNTNNFMLNQNQQNCGSNFSPSQMSPNYIDQFPCRSTKSCQFDSSNYKFPNDSNENQSDDTIIFIRDVGCQFRYKSYSPKDSLLQSKISSSSFDYVDVKMGNYYTNVHTLRYEDKYTNPLSADEQSYSIVSITSVDRDSECPSHGRRPGLVLKRPTTGFAPKSAYITAYSTVVQTHPPQGEDHKLDGCPVKSRRHFLKGKYKRIFSVKRRRKSKYSVG